MKPSSQCTDLKLKLLHQQLPLTVSYLEIESGIVRSIEVPFPRVLIDPKYPLHFRIFEDRIEMRFQLKLISRLYEVHSVDVGTYSFPDIHCLQVLQMAKDFSGQIDMDKDSEMAQYGEQYGRKTDEYGNPIHRPEGGATGGATGGAYGTTEQYGTTGAHMTGQHGGATGGGGAYGTTTGTGQHGGGFGTHGGGIATGTTGAAGHRRSGSSSSSSSEDDGQGGRRKKGLKDKIKEKLPGGHKDDQQAAQYEYGTGGAVGQHHEKKGVMEKIKEKLPGGGGAHH